jgi:hypothetical protein
MYTLLADWLSKIGTVEFANVVFKTEVTRDVWSTEIGEFGTDTSIVQFSSYQPTYKKQAAIGCVNYPFCYKCDTGTASPWSNL